MSPRNLPLPLPQRRNTDQHTNGNGGQIDPTSYLLAEHNTKLEALGTEMEEVKGDVKEIRAIVETIKDWTDDKQAGEAQGQQRRVIFETAVAESVAGAGVLVASPHLTLSVGQSNILLLTVAAIVAAAMLLWRWGL